MNFTTPCSIEGLVAGLIILLSCSICISKGIWLLHWEDVVMETRPCSIRKCCARRGRTSCTKSSREGWPTELLEQPSKTVASDPWVLERYSKARVNQYQGTLKIGQREQATYCRYRFSDMQVKSSVLYYADETISVNVQSCLRLKFQFES